MEKTKTVIESDICKCGHERKVHLHIPFSHNYTQGACSYGFLCTCKHFEMPSKNLFAVPFTPPISEPHYMPTGNFYCKKWKEGNCMCSDQCNECK